MSSVFQTNFENWHKLVLSQDARINPRQSWSVLDYASSSVNRQKVAFFAFVAHSTLMCTGYKSAYWLGKRLLGGAGGIRNHVQLGHCPNPIPVSPVLVSLSTLNHQPAFSELP